MQLALTILAGLGALIFVICFLGYVISGFRHHFVTGLISMLPVLNIVTLPSLWDKSSKKFLTGLIGLIIASGAWFMGGDKGVQNFISRGNTTTEEVVISTNPQITSNGTKSTTISPTKTIAKNLVTYDEEDMFALPSKALYVMGFDIVPINQISNLKGRIVQITKNNNELVEGRVKSIAPGSVIVEGLLENELPIASIKQLKLMVKKAN